MATWAACLCASAYLILVALGCGQREDQSEMEFAVIVASTGCGEMPCECSGSGNSWQCNQTVADGATMSNGETTRSCDQGPTDAPEPPAEEIESVIGFRGFINACNLAVNEYWDYGCFSGYGPNDATGVSPVDCTDKCASVHDQAYGDHEGLSNASCLTQGYNSCTLDSMGNATATTQAGCRQIDPNRCCMANNQDMGILCNNHAACNGEPGQPRCLDAYNADGSREMDGGNPAKRCMATDREQERECCKADLTAAKCFAANRTSYCAGYQDWSDGEANCGPEGGSPYWCRSGWLKNPNATCGEGSQRYCVGNWCYCYKECRQNQPCETSCTGDEPYAKCGAATHPCTGAAVPPDLSMCPTQ